MFINILIILVLIVSSAIFLSIVIKRLPDLKTLDFSKIPEEKQGGNKKRFLESKFLRENKKRGEAIKRAINPLKDKTGDWLEKIQDNVRLLERKYKKNVDIEQISVKSINELLAEAEAFIKNDDLSGAEKCLIEIISRDRKNFRAYELLSDVYNLGKNYHQAEEVIKYLIKLSLAEMKRGRLNDKQKDGVEDLENQMIEVVDIDNNLSRYYDDWGRVCEAMDKPERALEAYLKASAVTPNNPKFLDKIIELSIVVKDVGLAQKTYRRLKEINPENAKLEDFREALEKLK